MTRRLLLFFAAAALALPSAAAQEEEAVREFDYVVARDTPDWFKESFLDFPEDVAEAAAAGKRLMIYFGQDGCPYCKKLHDVNYTQAGIVETLQTRFDSVAVNIFGDVETVWFDGETYSEKDLSAKLKVQFTPTLLFLDEDGGEVLRLAGYQPPQKFTAALRYVAEKKEGEGFAAYLRRTLPKRAEARRQRPPVFARPPYALAEPRRRTAVFVTQGDCEACDEWRRFLVDSEEWHEVFRVVEIDMFGVAATIDDGVQEADWTARRRVSFVPALIFLDGDGGEEFRIDGYLRAFHLASVMDYVSSGAYKSEPEFQRFLQERSEKLRAAGEEVVIW